MFTRELRPQLFEDMVGQDLNKKLLRAIILNIEESPTSLILEGSFGTGKSTAARIFARAINCQNLRETIDPCLECEFCKYKIDSSPFYSEYDSSIIGNVDTIREMRDTFYYSPSIGYKVVVFDEAHMVSSAGQSALLKVLEDAPPNIFFIWATTDVEKLLSTIRSRSLELSFEKVSVEEIYKNLLSTVVKKDIRISSDALLSIAHLSGGHVRDAHMLLDKCLLLGEEEFSSSSKVARQEVLSYFEALCDGDKDGIFLSISNLMRYPLVHVTRDYQQILFEFISAMVESTGEARVVKIVERLSPILFKIFSFSMSDWAINSFRFDLTFQTFLLAQYQVISSYQENKKSSKQAVSVGGRNVKA